MYRMTSARLAVMASAVRRTLDEGEREHAERVSDLSYMTRARAAGELRVAAVYALASVSARLEGCASDFIRDMLDTSGIDYAGLAEHYAPDAPVDDEEG